MACSAGFNGNEKNMKNRTKLNTTDITMVLLSDSDDGESDEELVSRIKTSPISIRRNSSIRSPIIMKIAASCYENKKVYSIIDEGKNKKNDMSKPDKEDSSLRRKSSRQASMSTNSKFVNNSRPSRAVKNVPTYKEDVLFESSWKAKAFKTTRVGKKRSKSPEIKDNANDTEDSEESEGDENDMCNANQTSPSKRQKVISDLQKTPSKTNFLKSSPIKTPMSLRSTISCRTPCTDLKNLEINSPCTPTGCKRINKSLSISSAKKNLNLDSFESNLHCVNKKKAPYNDFSLNDDTDEALSESGDDGDKSYNPEEIEESSSDFSEASEEENDSDSDENSGPKNNYKSKTRPKTPSRNLLKTPSKSILKTPTSMETPTRQLSRLSLSGLTPSVRKRVSYVAKPTTPLQLARQKLHVSVLPKSLPCREEQFNDIYTFLTARLSDNTGGCIYISGVPGTGKTATVNEVIRILKKKMNEGSLPEFEYVEINGMKMTEPRQAYVQIWKQLTKESRTWEDAQKMLQERFSKRNSKRGMTLLLVDELDLLCTKRQDVIYNLLDWPSKKEAKLVVVTIANTMDLPERVFMGKVTSRLGLTRLTFPSYNFKQLEEIVLSRLKNQNAFDNDTIQLVARKVASVSGDARRALDICRRSTEVAEVNGKEMVTLAHVKQALDEMIASPKIQAIKSCSVMEKYFLQAVCAEVQRTGIQEVVFQNVYHSMQTLVAINGEKPPNVTQALSICARLGSYRLLLTENPRQDIHQRIILNVDSDDVYFATEKIEI